MRLFAVLGAYRLIVNSEIVHFCLFLSLAIKPEHREDEVENECNDFFDE